MASARCYKTCEQSCQQKSHNHQQQHSSIGQKVTDLYNGHHNDGTQTKTQYYSETDVIYQPGYVVKNQSNTCNGTRHNHTATGTTAAKCQGRNRKEEKHVPEDQGWHIRSQQ
ncbi:unnamed protein product [Vicia faba]|uniref:Uncharacterized protein n=1 Tax=Vicia faba TaxID=3906 RepID=A0AAV1BDC2_VICFA|nr:unnamed protein product [Vicia faba]